MSTRCRPGRRYESVLGDSELLQAVVSNKMVFFGEDKAKYELVRNFNLNAAPHFEIEERLWADYKAMDEMFFPGVPVPDFDELLVTLDEVDAAVAEWS